MPLKSVRGSVWGVTAAAVPVELRLEADDLPNRDTLSLSDPFAVVSSTHFGGGYEEIGRTETVWDELNPRWATALPLQYVPGINATALRIDVYDLDTEDGEALEKQDFLGTTYTTLAAVLNAADGVLTLPLVDRDESGDDAKTAAAAAAAAAAVTPARRASTVRRKRAGWGLGTLRLSAEVVHLQLRSEQALAAATAAVAHPARPPRSPHQREGPHSLGTDGTWGAGGPTSARRPPALGGSPLAAAKALAPPRASSGPRVTQPCLTAVTGDAGAAAASGGPVPAEWSFCVTVPPVYRRGVLGRSLASPVLVVERQRRSGGGWSTLYHTAALDKEAFAGTGAGHYGAAAFSAATLHNGARRRRLRFSFHDYHMRSANVRICEATLSFDELLTATPSAAWPLMGAESPTTQVGTLTFTARGGVAVPAGGGAAAADAEAAAAAAASSSSAAAMAVTAGGADAKATLLAAVGDAGTDGVELDVRVEWSALASPTFLGGSVAAGKAAADADGGCLGAAGGDGSGDSVPSWGGPRPFAGRRSSRRPSAARLDAGGSEGGGGAPDVASPVASPRVSVPPPNGAAAAFPTHAPFRPNGSLSTKLAQSLKKSMALH